MFYHSWTLNQGYLTTIFKRNENIVVKIGKIVEKQQRAMYIDEFVVNAILNMNGAAKYTAHPVPILRNPAFSVPW